MPEATYTALDVIYGMIPLVVLLFFAQFYEMRNELAKAKQDTLNSALKEQIQKTENKLSVTEDRFRNLIENLSDWVWETDKHGVYLYTSPSIRQLLGYEPCEIEGFSHRNFLFEGSFSKNNESFRNQIVKAKHKDGSLVVFEVSGQSILDSHGDFSGYRGVSRDISKRIEAENAQRESQKKLDTLLNATTDVAFLADPSGVFLAVNSALAERFGRKKEELIGKSIFEFTKTEALTGRRAQLEKIVIAKQPLRWEEEYDERYLDNSLYPILDDDGNLTQVAVFSRDITRRKQAEEERERLQQAIEQSSEAILITDSKGTIQYVNPAFTKITGYTSEEVIGQNPRVLKSEKQGTDLYQTMWATLTSGKPWHGQLVNKKKDGSHYTEDVTISPVKSRAGEIINYVAVKRDISQEIQAEELRTKLEKQLNQKYKMEALGLMAGGMAHNFNNSLAVILGNIELLSMEIPADATFYKRIYNIKIATFRARDLIKNIMIYSREGTHAKNLIQLPSVIHETLNLLRSTIPATIHIEQIISPDCSDATVNADSSQIQEALFNLCNNAVYAMDETGLLRVSLETVDLQAQDIPFTYDCLPGCYVKLSVQDNGSGMSAETIDKIFDPFFTTKEVGMGTGIGLATVQGIITHHNGLMKVKSILGEGTIFELYFPVLNSDPDGEKELENATLPGGTERILFVDDEEMLANLGEELLTGLGYQATTITDSTKALSLFAANAEHFDIVITDQTMPGICGKDLIQDLKKIRPDIPTILCTGYSNKVHAGTAAELGINAFLIKPVALPELLQTIRRVLDGAEIDQTPATHHP
jgi:PAS domain S-box-containing protein